jgi:glycosyltransferase involved in cell wall biosynthesis
MIGAAEGLRFWRENGYAMFCKVVPCNDGRRAVKERARVLASGRMALLCLNGLDVVQGDVTRFNVQAMARIAQILRRHKPRIAHFHFHYVDLLSLYPWVARLASGADVFFTDHGSCPESHRAERVSLAKRYLARAINWPVSKVICVSDYSYRSLVERALFPAVRCKRIYNGVDLGRVVESRERAAAFRRRFSIPEGRTVVTQVSWIIPEKGILDVLEAARLVLAERTAAHFVIVGEGPFRGEYMAKEGLPERVSIKPYHHGLFDWDQDITIRRAPEGFRGGAMRQLQ